MSALGHLERHDDAAQPIEDLMKVKPGFSIATIDETLRFARSADREHYLDGLRKAGLQPS